MPKLFAGSWINHNFAIWIGHEEDNTPGTHYIAPQHLRQRASGEHTDPNRIRQAGRDLQSPREVIGFGWFGDDHSSAQDDVFDTCSASICKMYI